jgi:tyrosyl-tRNA synthetase
MEHKMQLAHLIVRDFHSEDAARQAAADFDREVRQHDVPTDIETQKYPSGTVKVPKMLQDTGLAPSRTEAERLVKSGAVTVDGERLSALTLELAPGAVHTLRVGKKWKRIQGE